MPGIWQDLSTGSKTQDTAYPSEHGVSCEKQFLRFDPLTWQLGLCTPSNSLQGMAMLLQMHLHLRDGRGYLCHAVDPRGKPSPDRRI